jgi:hypothetical protein
VNNLLAGVSRFSFDGFTVEDYNAAVKMAFGPYVKRRGILTSHREELRVELVNLARVMSVPGMPRFLRRIISEYQMIIQADKVMAFKFLRDCFEGHARSDEIWMSLFLTNQSPSRNDSLYDRVFKTFGLLDGLLEGRYKSQLRILFGFAVRKRTGQFPTGINARILGRCLIIFLKSIRHQHLN